MTQPMGVAWYGSNGHQVQRLLVNQPRAKLVAVAGTDPAVLQKAGHDVLAVRQVESVSELIQQPGVEWVSLCSPKRREQAGHAMMCLQAGKHVYAEKSYPWRDHRPQDDTIDGRLIRWVAVHTFRLVEHITGLHITQGQTLEATIGNPHFPQGGGGPVSSVMMLR